MKKMALLQVVARSYQSLRAQNDSIHLEPFKMDLGLGYANPPNGIQSKLGGAFSLEPQYAVINQLDIGLRLEADLMINTTKPVKNEKDPAVFNGLERVTVDYYFTHTGFHPCVGRRRFISHAF